MSAPKPQPRQTRLRRQVESSRRRVQVWSGRHLPPGMRLVVGALLMVGGVFGFLPVVGFWMLPLGIAVAAMDVKPLWQRIRRK